MIITPEQLDKIELLDKFFNSVNMEQLKEFSESEQIVSKLAGRPEQPRVLSTMVNEIHQLKDEIYSLRVQMLTINDDFKSIIKTLNTITTPQYVPDLQTLRNKHNIY